MQTSYLNGLLQDHLHVISGLSRVLDDVLAAATLMTNCIEAGNKILWAGNGGSAADAQHLSAELVGRYQIDRRGLPSLSLATDPSAVTAIANDFGYENLFSRQVEALGVTGDVVVGISTSGRSPNVVQAARKAKQMGVFVVALCGVSGTPLANLSDCAICIDSKNTARIQEAHILVGHMICDCIEQSITGKL